MNSIGRPSKWTKSFRYDSKKNGLKKNPYYMRHIFLYGIDNLLICYLDSAILQTLSDIYQALHILFFLKFNLDKLNNLLTIKFFVRRATYFRIIVLRPLSFAWASNASVTDNIWVLPREHASSSESKKLRVRLHSNSVIRKFINKIERSFRVNLSQFESVPFFRSFGVVWWSNLFYLTNP